MSSAGLDARSQSDHFASSIADRVTTILHPFYEVYLLKLLSHSDLLLYTEDSVVLKSVSITKSRWEETRRSIASPSYHTGGNLCIDTIVIC